MSLLGSVVSGWSQLKQRLTNSHYWHNSGLLSWGPSERWKYTETCQVGVWAPCQHDMLPWTWTWKWAKWTRIWEIRSLTVAMPFTLFAELRAFSWLLAKSSLLYVLQVGLKLKLCLKWPCKYIWSFKFLRLNSKSLHTQGTAIILI